MATKPHVVVIGAGHAGVQAAVSLAESENDVSVTLVDEAQDFPYERPPLSKDELAADRSARPKLLRGEDVYTDLGIRLVRGDGAVRIDRIGSQVELASGAHLPYTHLVLATGSTPLMPRIPGTGLRGVHQVKVLEDSRALREELRPGRRIIVIGAGYIGLEVASAATNAGCDVVMVEQQDRIMARVTSEVVSRFYEELHRAEGVRLMLGDSVARIEGESRVERVVTASGEVLEADAVVIGVGVRPHQMLAEHAGIRCDDGILVDSNAQTSDPQVYAVGDAARAVTLDHPEGLRLESVQNAVALARSAAQHILGAEPLPAEVPWFWTIQHGVRLQTAGLRRPDDEIVVRGNPQEGKFSVLYLRGGVLAAVDTIGSLRDFVPAKKLIDSKASIDRELAMDPSVKLAATVIEPIPDETEKSPMPALPATPTAPATAVAAINVIDRNGGEHVVSWDDGQTLMEALRDNGQPVLASCGGTASCATCHVHLAPDVVSRLGERSEDEFELLEDAEDFDAATSRLSCQVKKQDWLAGAVVRLAEEE